MAQGKQTPRQKMINLMYLVFIAMLAMQIDQEIIRSYRDTNQSLTDTRALTQKNNTIFEQTLRVKARDNQEYIAAVQQYDGLKAKADALVAEIEGIKAQLSKDAEYNPSLDISESFTALNNTDPSTQFFFERGDEGKPSKQAASMKAKIDDFRNYVISNFSNNGQMQGVVERAKSSSMQTEFQQPINNKNWLQYKFYNQPLIAALSNLEVIESAARGIQTDALMVMLQEKVDANIQFDAFRAIVSAPTTVIQGENAVAEVAIGNYSSNVPGLSMPGLTVTNGVGKKQLNTSSVGQQSFSGTINFTDAKGKTLSLPYNHTYNVIAGAKEVALQSGALVSADKMNVLYRGLPNPVSGSILGADNSQTSLSASGASVSGGRGKWTVTPTGGNQVTLTISGKDPKGKTISQSFPFRVKNVPPPVGEIRGQSVVSMPASSIPNQTVSVNMPDFDFPVSFSVNSFMFKVPGKPAMQVSGNSLRSVEGLVRNLRSGDIAYVFKINATATGLGNQQLKEIPPVVINVQ